MISLYFGPYLVCSSFLDHWINFLVYSDDTFFCPNLVCYGQQGSQRPENGGMDNKGHRDQKMAVGEEIDELYCKTIVIK